MMMEEGRRKGKKKVKVSKSVNKQTLEQTYQTRASRVDGDEGDEVLPR